MSSSPLQMTPSQLNGAQSEQWKAILKQSLFDLRVAIPAQVKDFDEIKQVVTVQILVSELVRLPKGPQWTAISPIYNVPILVPRAGGFAITMPISPGDEGLLIFCDQCIDLWWQEGGQQPPPMAPLTQPNFERRRHDITDCGFFPGLWNQKNVLENYSTESIQVRSDDGTTYVDVSDTGIKLVGTKVMIQASGDVDITAGGTVHIEGSSGINIESDSDNTNIDGQDFLDHTHTGVQTGGGNSGPVTP